MPKGSDKIKTLRMQTQLSQNKFARGAGMDSATYRKAENGKENVSELTISRIATALSALLKKQITAADLTAKDDLDDAAVTITAQTDVGSVDPEITQEK